MTTTVLASVIDRINNATSGWVTRSVEEQDPESITFHIQDTEWRPMGCAGPGQATWGWWYECTWGEVSYGLPMGYTTFYWYWSRAGTWVLYGRQACSDGRC